MKRLLLLLTAFISISISAAEPKNIGKKLSELFLTTEPEFYNPDGYGNATHYGNNQYVHYATVSYWTNCLEFARISGDKELEEALIAKFEPFFAEKKALLNRKDHLDYAIFGSVPLEIYLLNGDKRCLELGLEYADAQWEEPLASGHKFQGNPSLEELQAFWKDGYSSHTRIWIDDMYMINVLQTQAYRATGDYKYLERSARQMAMYLDKIQNPDGLFYHAVGRNFVWGRGDGWLAAGMPLILKYIKADDPNYGKIMAGYKKMMEALLKWQRPNGLWGQLVNDEESWDETSGSAMFAYGMLEGVKHGWLPETPYREAALKAFDALCDNLNEFGGLKGVCMGTGARNDRDWYLGRPRIDGDPHGQAPMMWICNSLCSTPSEKWTVHGNVFLSLNREDGIYAKGDTVRVWAEACGTPSSDLVLRTTKYCQWKDYSQKSVILHEGDNLLLETVYDENAQYVFELTDGKEPNNFTKTGNTYVGLVVAPEEFVTVSGTPSDFMKFWKREIKDMRREKMDPTITRDSTAGGLRTYHVDINCVGPAPVRAYVSYPADAKKKSLPIIISFHAAGSPGTPSNASYARRNAQMPEGGAIGIDINAHGMLDDQPKAFYNKLNAGELKGYAVRKPTLPDYYFKWMMLRAERMVDYAAGNPLWDGKHIIVMGSSQGGYQSAWLAGIDPRISTAVLTVPAGLDQRASHFGRPVSWPRTMNSYPEETDAVIPYMDPAGFLRNTKADIWCEIGLFDFTCPAANLFAVMNTLKTPVTIVTSQRPHSKGMNSRSAKKHEEIEAERVNYIRKAAKK